MYLILQLDLLSVLQYNLYEHYGGNTKGESIVVETDRGFLRRDVPMPDLSNEKIFPGGIKVKALFTPNMKWRLVEEFGPNCFTETDDGRLLFSADYTDMENLVTWLMTFGAKVEVLEPEEVRDIIRRNAEEILKIYGGLGK